MSSPEAEKAAQRDSASGLPEFAVLPGLSNSDAIPKSFKVQATRRREPRRERELATVVVGMRQRLRIISVEAGGRQLVELRQWFLDRDGAWRPSGDHVHFPPSLFAEIVAALVEAEKAERRR